MGEKWWDHTFNPWLGCTKISPACKNCYAEAGAKRFGQAEWGPEAIRNVVSDATWRHPINLNRKAKESGTRARVFCASWADVFEDRPELDAPRARLWALIEQTPQLDWLLTTKRPQNIARMIPPAWRDAMPHNVWLGTTTESQKYADERIPHLIECRAVVTFVSVEPQLGPIDLSGYLGQLDWVICGGESGSRARPTQVAWARSIRDQCKVASVSFFFKQWGQHAQIGSTEGLIRLRTKNERLLDGQSWDEYPTPRTKGRSMQNEDLEVADPEDSAALESELSAILVGGLSGDGSKLARSRAHRRAKQIYEQLHPETRHGGARRPEQVVKNTTWPAYVKYAADKTGLSSSTICKAIALNDELANLDERAEEAIFGTALANQIAFVKRIAQLPDPAAQRDVVQIFDASGKKIASKALAQYEEKAGLAQAAAHEPPHVDEEVGEQAPEEASEATPIDEPESEAPTPLALVCQALAVSTAEEAIEKIDALKAENLALREAHTLMRERFQAAMNVSANDPVIAPRMLEIIPQMPALRFLLQ